MSSNATRQRFKQQFKDHATRLVIEHGCSCEETSRRLGVSANNISRWSGSTVINWKCSHPFEFMI